jgi:hypothetical protein
MSTTWDPIWWDYTHLQPCPQRPSKTQVYLMVIALTVAPSDWFLKAFPNVLRTCIDIQFQSHSWAICLHTNPDCDDNVRVRIGCSSLISNAWPESMNSCLSHELIEMVCHVLLRSVCSPLSKPSKQRIQITMYLGCYSTATSQVGIYWDEYYPWGRTEWFPLDGPAAMSKLAIL